MFDQLKIRPEACFASFGAFLVVAVTQGTVHFSHAAAAGSDERCQISSGDLLSPISDSGELGSGDGGGSTMAGSGTGLLINTVFQFGVQRAVNQTNGTNHGTAKTTVKYPDAMHWSSRLTQLEKLAKNKNGDKERLRQYLNHTVTILLDVRLGKDNVTLCNSSTHRFEQLPIGGWRKVLEGADKLLTMLEVCFPYIFVNTSHCTAERSNLTDRTGRSSQQSNISERDGGRSQTAFSVKGQAGTFRAWTKLLKKHFSSVQNVSKDWSILMKASPKCQLLECQRSLVAMQLNVVSSAVMEILGLYSDLHDFAVLLSALRSWKTRTSALLERNNDSAPNSQVGVDTFYLLNLTMSSLSYESLAPKTCKEGRFCRDAKRMLVYFDRLPFILSAKKLRLEHVVALICQNMSGLENHAQSYSGSICPETGESVCVHDLTLNCTADFFVRTSRSHSSFSPELFHHEYITRVIGYSFIEENWSKFVREPWCRLGCTPGSGLQTTSVQMMVNILVHAGNVLLLVVVFFACYLIFFNKRNLFHMTRNPRRTYLYLNFIGVFAHFFYHSGNLSPSAEEGNWCNSDGSVVVDNEDASPACKLEASIGFTANVVQVVILLWVAFTWTRTLIVLQNLYRVEEEVYWAGLTFHELVEVLVAVTTGFIAVATTTLPVLADDLVHASVEGFPAMKLCIFFGYFDSPFLYGSYLIVNIAVGIGFFLFSRTFRKLTLERERTCGAMHRAAHQQDTKAVVLRKWLNRHVLFGTVLFARAVIYTFSFFGLLVDRSSHSPKALSDAFRSCVHSFQCSGSCAFYPPPNSLAPAANVVLLILCIINYFEFSWVFFDEIEWNALSRVRPGFKL